MWLVAAPATASEITNFFPEPDGSDPEATDAASLNSTFNSAGSTVSIRVVGNIDMSSLMITAGGKAKAPTALHVVSGKTVVLWSAEGAMLDANGTGRLLVVHEGGRLRLENITLANGLSDSGGCLYHEGGVLSVRGGLFLKCAARDSSGSTLLGRSSSGGGIFMQAGLVDLTDTEFNACEASSIADANGGGMGTWAGDLNLVNTRFVNTRVYSQDENAWGGGISIWRASRVTARGTSFDGGNATSLSQKAFGGCLGLGGGGDAVFRETSIRDCTVTTVHGTQALGGGVGIDGAGTLVMRSANITSCTARLEDGSQVEALVGGGGVGSLFGRLDLQDVIISDSSATPAHIATGAALLSSSIGFSAAVLTIQQDCGSAGTSMMAAINGETPTLRVRDLRYDPSCVDTLTSNVKLEECGSMRSSEACGPSAFCSMSDRSISTPVCECPPTDPMEPYVQWLPNAKSWSPAFAAYTEGCEQPSLADWQLNANWWRLTNATEDVRKCIPDWQVGDPTPCIGGSDATSYCREGLNGMRCHACVEDNHYFSRSRAECTQCGSSGTKALMPVASIVLACTTVSSLLLCLLAGLRKQKKKQSRLSLSRLLVLAKNTGLVAKAKLAVSYYNIVLVIPEAFAVELPQEYYDNMRVVSWMNIKIYQIGDNVAECLGNFEVRLRLLSATPIFLLAGLVLGGVLASLISTWYRTQLSVDVALKASRRGLRSTLPFLLAGLFVFVSPVSSRIFSTYACETVGVDDSEGTSSSFLYADLAIECTGASYRALTKTAFALVVLWPIGVPVFFACLLAMSHDRPQALALWSAIGFLHNEYVPAYYWWELVELTRKLMLTGFIFLIPQRHIFTRLIVAIQVSFSFCVLVACASPYKHASTTYFAVVINVTLGCTMLVALCIKVRAELDYDTAENLLGFDSTLPLARTILALNLSVLVLVLAQNARNVRHAAGTLKMIRLRNGGKLPVLELAPGKRWFLFISYTKANQETATTIKPQVQLLLPGATVYLNVDDRESRQDIEQDVQSSAVMLVVQGSPRYTSSADCLREAAAARQSELPLVRVHEWDGPSMGALRRACPEEHRDFLFGSSTVILWHRLKDFQQLALALICERLLLATPTYSDLTTLPLVVPGGLAWSTPTFEVPVGLYISQHNPEAKFVAGQLSERFALSMVDRSTTAAANLLVRWLLMLTPTAFEGEAGSLLVAELSAALRDGIAPIMLFVPQKCTFDDVLQVTPQALIDAGLYSGRPALEWHSGAFRPVSERQVARELGALLAPRRCRWLRERLPGARVKAAADEEAPVQPVITWNSGVVAARSSSLGAAATPNEIELDSCPRPSIQDVYPSFQWSSDSCNSSGTPATPGSPSSDRDTSRGPSKLSRASSSGSAYASPRHADLQRMSSDL